MFESSNLFNKEITIYHGSEFVINKPEHGVGKFYNDYGLGFYTTENKPLAGEWAVLYTGRSGYINEYIINLDGLRILDLNSVSIEYRVSILMANRGGSFQNIAISRRTKFIDKFYIDHSSYDIIKGWRADDSFFDYVNDFLMGALSIESLTDAITLGNLGEQICLKSVNAFNSIKFKSHENAPARKYLDSAKKRDISARTKYRTMENKDTGRLITDIIGRG